MLNFNHLYSFHVTAAEGAVKAAADHLGVTQPTVSEQIRLLERNLGVQLFERLPGGLRLTQAGRDAFEHTTAMFLAGERLLEAVGHSGPSSTVSLRVGMSAAMARTVAADFLMPILKIERCRPLIRTGDFSELLRDLRARELDLLVGETELVDGAKIGMDVALIQKPVLLALGHPALEPREGWENLSILEYRPSSAYHWEVDNFLRVNGLRPTPVGAVDDAFLMLEAVARGGFVAFVPKSIAREAVRSGKVKVLASFSPVHAGVHAIYPSTDASDAVREAVEQLIAHAGETVDAPLST